MNRSRTAPGAGTAEPHGGTVPGSREASLSLRMLWWVPVSPLVGFALAGRVLGLGVLWKAVLLGVVLMSPFAVGAFFGLRAVRLGSRRGWVGLGANLVLSVITVVMPIAESLTS